MSLLVKSRTLIDPPPNFLETPFQKIHFSNFIGENIEKLKFEKSVDKVVAIHDPCDLGRSPEGFEGTRTVLNAIPGIRVKEIKHYGKDTLCCGSRSSDHSTGEKAGLRCMEEVKTRDLN